MKNDEATCILPDIATTSLKMQENERPMQCDDFVIVAFVTEMIREERDILLLHLDNGSLILQQQ